MKWNKWMAAALLLSLLLTGCQSDIPGEGSVSTSADSSSHQGSDISTEVPGNSTSGSAVDISTLPPDQSTEIYIPVSPVKPTEITFPYIIPGTQLVVRGIRSYDGLFLEDGSDREVTGISTIILENRGSGIEYANITLIQGDRQLQFKATAIPGGTQAVVQESNAAEYRIDDYTQCSVDIASLETFEKSQSIVLVEENENGSLMVTNLTDKMIPCVRIFYKFALEPGQIYVGGITYTAKVLDLKPGKPQNITPSHYAAGSSEIMMVRTYETAQ